jgi:hypothetical protein
MEEPSYSIETGGSGTFPLAFGKKSVPMPEIAVDTDDPGETRERPQARIIGESGDIGQGPPQLGARTKKDKRVEVGSDYSVKDPCAEQTTEDSISE